MGASRPTQDVDVDARSDADNLDRLGAALRELHAQIRGAPPMPDSVIAAQTTAEARVGAALASSWSVG